MSDDDDTHDISDSPELEALMRHRWVLPHLSASNRSAIPALGDPQVRKEIKVDPDYVSTRPS